MGMNHSNDKTSKKKVWKKKIAEYLWLEYVRGKYYDVVYDTIAKRPEDGCN